MIVSLFCGDLKSRNIEKDNKRLFTQTSKHVLPIRGSFLLPPLSEISSMPVTVYKVKTRSCCKASGRCCLSSE